MCLQCIVHTYPVVKFVFKCPFCQVYRTQMERLSSGFSTKISEFENINGNLRRSLVDLKQQNDDLRVQVRLHLNLLLGKLSHLLLHNSLRNELLKTHLALHCNHKY